MLNCISKLLHNYLTCGTKGVMRRMLCIGKAFYPMKKVYFALVCSITLLTACSSPAKKQHYDKRIKINTFQNNSAEATTEHKNTISSGNLTDSVHRVDTGGKQ